MPNYYLNPEKLTSLESGFDQFNRLPALSTSGSG